MKILFDANYLPYFLISIDKRTTKNISIRYYYRSYYLYFIAIRKNTFKLYIFKPNCCKTKSFFYDIINISWYYLNCIYYLQLLSMAHLEVFVLCGLIHTTVSPKSFSEPHCTLCISSFIILYCTSKFLIYLSFLLFMCSVQFDYSSNCCKYSYLMTGLEEFE